MLRIEAVDPVQFAAEGARILKASWAPPALEYTPEYLKWQFTFPAPLPPIGFAAFYNDSAIGFVAASARYMHVAGTTVPVYLSSFLSVLPDLPTGSAAALLIRNEARQAASRETPVLLFAQEGSAGQAILANKMAGMQRRSLGSFRIHMAAARKHARAEVELTSPSEWLRHYRVLNSPDGVLSPVYDEAHLAHYGCDPWGRRFAIARSGAETAVAMIGSIRSVTAQGTQVSPALHAIAPRNPHPDLLKALIQIAAASTPEATQPTVTVPLASLMSPDTAKASGLRAMNSTFASYLYTPDSCRVDGAESTSCEIV